MFRTVSLRGWPLRLLVAVLIVLALAWLISFGLQLARTPALSEAKEPAPPAAPQIGQAAPDFTLSTLDGKQASLSSFQGRPVLLYFWATWCPYCVKEMSKLQAIHDRYKDQGLAVLGIDILEDVKVVARYIQTEGYSFPILLDRQGSVAIQYLVHATPAYFFVDREGVLQGRIVGSTSAAAIEGMVFPILKELESPQRPR